MAEFIEILQEFKTLPKDVHIFCPRHGDEDNDRYDDPPNPATATARIDLERLGKIEEGRKRRKRFVSSLQLLAYDGKESEQFQRFIWETTDQALGKCDVCIKEYYLAKADFKEQLRVDYEEDDVANFFAIINRRDVKRIVDNLDDAEQKLLETPEQKRGTGTLEVKQMHALYEALVCQSLLDDEVQLQKHFDGTFRMIQTKKPLKMRLILPAATQFLFDPDAIRSHWARAIWNRLDRCPTDIEWNWAIKDCLQKKLQEASDPIVIARLWQGLETVVKCLDSRMITHQLFDLTPNLCVTALNHLNKKTKAVPYLLATMSTILERAPQAFWQAMGSISSPTIVEQVFASPLYNQELQGGIATTEDGSTPKTLSWMHHLLDSLKPANRPPATASLVKHLFERVDNKVLDLPTRQACFEQVVSVLLKTVVAFADESESKQQSAERLVYVDTLTMVGERLGELLKPNDTGLRLKVQSDTDDLVDLVKNSIALECKCLKLDFENLARQDPQRQENSAYTPRLWSAIVENMRNDSSALATAALRGMMSLPGLEQFRVKESDKMATEKKTYNSIFEKVNAMVGRLLERISELKDDQLDALYKAQDTSMPLIAALFSPDQNVYEAAITMAKTLSGESGRKEALGHLFDAFLGTTIYGICWLFRRVANYKTFGSIPRILKNGMDILDVLCNTSDGYLRRSNKLSPRDFKAVQSYWSYQWILLKTVFGATERWSGEVHNKEVMKEVCRDAMQYADELFKEYDLFASLVVRLKPERSTEIRKTLLDSTISNDKHSGSPLDTLDTMCKWLRLRDDYLADTLVKLVINMFGQLRRHDAISTNSEGLAYVENVAVGTTVRTILTASQKAELVRALENYLGYPVEKPMARKQGILNMNKWSDSATVSRTSTPDSRERSVEEEFGDDGIDDDDMVEIASRTLNTPKTTITTKDKSHIKTLLMNQPPAKPKPAPPTLLEIQAKKAQDSKSFIENRRREEAARKLREKEAAARLRGRSGIGAQTAGQGSGLAGLGVVGKDHSTGPNSLMVSSESEQDSDSDDELFGFKNKGPTIRENGLPRKAVSAGPVRKIKQQRTQKDIRARLAPDLSELHRTMLGWDFFANVDVPPNSTKEDYTLVTDTFRNAQDYQKTFEPLLILEAWQSFRSAREEREDGSSKAFEIMVASSMIVDSFFEINSSMSFQEGKDLGIGASDVVLLSKSNRPIQNPNEPHCLARVKEITRKKGQVQVVYRVNAGNNPLRPYLNDKTSIWGVQIQSLTPLEREYGALMALQYYDLCDEIIRAKPSPILDYKDEEVRPIQKTYDVNLAQAKAVKSALDNDAFTLIQGPPGSGKTKTITALVGAMLTGHVQPQAASGHRMNTAPGAPKAPPVKKKLLVCAPSNAAVDELVMRFKTGIKMLNGSTENISVVRLGRSEAINSNVKDVTLEELVTARLAAVAPKGAHEDVHSVMMEHKKLSEEIRALTDSINDRRGKGEPVPTGDEQLMDMMRRKRNTLSTQIDKMKENQNSASRDSDMARKRIQQEVLDGAHVLCATLSGSGHELFQSLNVEFETVIIDEAAQSIELSALIPLKYGCSKCILVGDPKQLPPTVLSRTAAKYQYEQSLFARMENNHKKDVHLLDTQYRMHPEISLFPSTKFYDSRLKDGAGMAKLRRRPWHHSEIFAPYRFFDVQGMSQAATKGHSLVNHAEIDVAMQIYRRLTTDVRRYDFNGKIGIITPYKGQMRELKRRFQNQYGESITSKIEFNTTDAFQGRESEIIIFSCVRATTTGIGFLNDIRRMNVGLTRAKCSLWVLGNSPALSRGEYWNALIQDAKTRKVYTDGNIIGLLNQRLLTDDMMKDDVEMVDDDPASSTTNNNSSLHGDDRQIDPMPTSVPGVRVAVRQQDEAVKSLPSRPSGIDRHADQNVTRRPDLSRQNSGQTPSTAELTRQNTTPSVTRQEPARRDMPQLSSLPPRRTAAPREEVRSDAMDYSPAGGFNGLNDLHCCGTCGSLEHFTSACDNTEALAGKFGSCRRCQLAGHTVRDCSEPRCLSCGVYSHNTKDCRAPNSQKLTREEQESVRKEEIKFGEQRDKARQHRAEKKLNAQQMPTIKSTAMPTNGAEAKRKRDDSSSSSDRSKAPRTSDAGYRGGDSYRPPPDTPSGPRDGPPVIASRPSPHAPAGPRNGSPSTASRPLPTGPARLPPRPPGRPLGGMGTAHQGQAMIKKKKPSADDMFMKRK